MCQSKKLTRSEARENARLLVAIPRSITPYSAWVSSQYVQAPPKSKREGSLGAILHRPAESQKIISLSTSQAKETTKLPDIPCKMSGASDKARFYLEQAVPQLQEFKEKKIFDDVS
jgi:hypothetical protein